ncbi:2-oxo-4-hydroxy-4-carboxy-5-ureidoimidazoline decarboxylase [Actinomadura rudentiformis]|uniref:2-oxo-4-hydroxy-4-carboxy-5-ureidoimidazoline decarboxylase n=1 Tax=Actinomadura rudentiformis TaxID=359158 RepID=A0A6H9YD87_9ACTN|nr:2-oxo-4-hydroxy-4-carboxy-5-ureidoimidazoline decarboxylase [Actinomadura rudentiformis]
MRRRKVPVTTGARQNLERFNVLPVADAESELLTCCASRRWAAAVAGGRPFGDPAALLAAAARELAGLDWQDVLEALEAHPRIGERVAGQDRESAWSRGEQSGMDAAAAELRAAMIEGNRAYEARFDHVFLICATGRSAAEMLGRLQARLGNDEDTERAVVRDELAKIVELRLTKLLNEPRPAKDDAGLAETTGDAV